MQDYIEYVEEQLKYFQKHSNLSEEEEVTPLQLNSTLAHYSNVGAALIGEYARCKRRHYNTNRDYQRWHDEKFYAARKSMADEYEGKTIKIAVKEVENAVRVENATEYWEWQDKINDLDEKLSLIRRLIDQWAKLDNVLNNLSRNMRQEMVSLSIENRMNRSEKPDAKLRTEFPKPKGHSGEVVDDTKPPSRRTPA